MPKHQPAAMPSPEFIEKLYKICGLLGSDHDGERAAAALKASRMLQGASLTWSDVLKPSEPSAPPTETPETYSRLNDIHPGDLMAECIRWRRVLTDWQQNFLLNVNRRLTPPTEKQLSVLRAIAEIVWRAGGFR
jgi:hypothetical protein